MISIFFIFTLFKKACIIFIDWKIECWIEHSLGFFYVPCLFVQVASLMSDVTTFYFRIVKKHFKTSLKHWGFLFDLTIIDYKYIPNTLLSTSTFTSCWIPLTLYVSNMTLESLQLVRGLLARRAYCAPPVS